MRDPAANLPSVHFQLRFTGSAHTDPAARPAGSSTRLPRQVSPRPGQPRQPVLVLGQLHLHRPLFGLGMACEDIQDQGCAVDHLHILPQHPLDFALLARRKLFIEDHHIRAQLQDQRLQFAQFARADERSRVGMLEPLRQLSLHLQSRGPGQQGQFAERVLHREYTGLTRQADADQDRRLLRFVGQDQALVIPYDCAKPAFACTGKVIDRGQAA